MDANVLLAAERVNAFGTYQTLAIKGNGINCRLLQGEQGTLIRKLRRCLRKSGTQ